jgi:hypothetical protein
MLAVRSGVGVCAKPPYNAPTAVDPVTTGVSNIRTETAGTGVTLGGAI